MTDVIDINSPRRRMDHSGDAVPYLVNGKPWARWKPDPLVYTGCETPLPPVEYSPPPLDVAYRLYLQWYVAVFNRRLPYPGTE